MPSVAVAELLEYDRHAILAGELWRLWTCHLVHYSASHALADYASAVAAAAIAGQLHGWRRLAGALLLAAPLIATGLLLLAPDCQYYRGASGLAVMLTVLAAVALWRRAGARARLPLALLGLALAAKIAAEAWGLTANWSALPAGVRVAWPAHLLGAGCAAIFAAKKK
jgi:rhomboid family GlyGly-CTERM serine protease